MELGGVALRIFRGEGQKGFRFAESHISQRTSEIWGTRPSWKVGIVKRAGL
jgi:hypothetical protein